MATQTFQIKFGVNEGLTFSASEIAQQYLYGIDVKAKDGTALSDFVFKQKVLTAQQQLEQYLSVKLFRQVFMERLDFIRADYYSWGFFKLSFPIRVPLELAGFIGTVQQIKYPLGWASTRQISDEGLLGRGMHIVPAGTTTFGQSPSVVFSGITPHLGFMGVDSIPNYWSVKYVTGFKNIPYVILDAVGKLAAIQILAIVGDIVLGAGISSVSLGIDGLSQSLSKSSGNAFSERIKQYQQELTVQLKDLQDYYRGINFMAL